MRLINVLTVYVYNIAWIQVIHEGDSESHTVMLPEGHEYQLGCASITCTVLVQLHMHTGNVFYWTQEVKAQ